VISRFWLARREQLDLVVYFHRSGGPPLLEARNSGGPDRPRRSRLAGGPPPRGPRGSMENGPAPHYVRKLDYHAGGFAVAMGPSRRGFAAGTAGKRVVALTIATHRLSQSPVRVTSVRGPALRFTPSVVPACHGENLRNTTCRWSFDLRRLRQDVHDRLWTQSRPARTTCRPGTAFIRTRRLRRFGPILGPPWTSEHRTGSRRKVAKIAEPPVRCLV